MVNGQYDAASLFIGLGNMGRPIVENYAHIGRELFVYDVDSGVATATAEATGATALENLAAVPKQVRTVILMLPNSRI